MLADLSNYNIKLHHESQRMKASFFLFIAQRCNLASNVWLQLLRAKSVRSRSGTEFLTPFSVSLFFPGLSDMRNNQAELVQADDEKPGSDEHNTQQ